MRLLASHAVCITLGRAIRLLLGFDVLNVIIDATVGYVTERSHVHTLAYDLRVYVTTSLLVGLALTLES